MNRYKNLSGKIMIKGDIVNSSPFLIGGAFSDNTDNDVMKDKNDRFGAPFIPATSLIGVLRRTCYENISCFGMDEKQLDELWGKSNPSLISCSDLYLNENYRKREEFEKYVEIRDCIKIDSRTGLTKDKAKFDFETVKRGSHFTFDMEIDLLKGMEESGKMFAKILFNYLNGGFSIGAKTNSGLGKVKLIDGKLYYLDFSKEEDIKNWLNDSYSDKNILDSEKNKYTFKGINDKRFTVILSLEIKNSIIIKHYPDNPVGPDAVNIKSNGKYVLTGTSIKGALRARAEKILNTINEYNNAGNKNNLNPEILLNDLFGIVIVKEGEKEGLKGESFAMPSRVSVDETDIDLCVAELQHRIKIDRFTGGVIEGGLFDAVPLFPIKLNGGDAAHIKNFKISVKNPTDSDIGLILLVVKDLWMGDLAIGGEKNIGRGVFKGRYAELFLPGVDMPISFLNLDELKTHKEKLQVYIDSLNKTVVDEDGDIKEYKKREQEVKKYFRDNMPNIK